MFSKVLTHLNFTFRLLICSLLTETLHRPKFTKSLQEKLWLLFDSKLQFLRILSSEDGVSSWTSSIPTIFRKSWDKLREKLEIQSEILVWPLKMSQVPSTSSHHLLKTAFSGLFPPRLLKKQSNLSNTKDLWRSSERGRKFWLGLSMTVNLELFKWRMLSAIGAHAND